MKENFLEYFQRVEKPFNYTGVLWTLCSVIALITGIIYYKKEKSYSLFLLYCLSSLILSSVPLRSFLYFSQLDRIVRDKIINLLNSYFAIIEFSAFIYFFKQILAIKKFTYIINLLWASFVSFCLFFMFRIAFNETNQNQRIKIVDLILSIEFTIFLLFCFMYFFQLLTKDAIRVKSKLADEPSFWIVNGLFFYSIVSLPLMLISNELLVYPEIQRIMYTIHYISISILLICIAKAFSCKTSLTA